MKILYITTIGGTMNFFKSLIKELIDEGHIVDIATNETDSKVPDCYREWGCKVFSIPTSRSPFSMGNVKAVTLIKAVVQDYDIVHCHTPLAAMATRLACRNLRKKGLKVIYTAHGFHFYKGAPLKNWLIYYPIEKVCSYWTDILITINKEDYTFAQKKMKAGRVEYIPGVGIDTHKFSNAVVDIGKEREKIGVPKDAFVVLSVGELNSNKNHQIVIRAIKEIGEKNIHYIVAGSGNKKKELESLAESLGVSGQVHLLGYRTDVVELYRIANVYALPSIREGLNVSVMEALSSGLPVLCTNIRGNVDMVKENENGYLIDPFDAISVANGIRRAKLNLIEKEKCFNSARLFDLFFINGKVKACYLSAKRGNIY